MGGWSSKRYLCENCEGCKSPLRNGGGDAGGTLPVPMYTSFLGNCASCAGERFRFRATTSGGALVIQSVTLNVPNSEKWPLSNPSKKWHSPGPSPCKACPCPRGKYQVSPTSKSATSACPSGIITVTRHRPSSM